MHVSTNLDVDLDVAGRAVLDEEIGELRRPQHPHLAGQHRAIRQVLV